MIDFESVYLDEVEHKGPRLITSQKEACRAIFDYFAEDLERFEELEEVLEAKDCEIERLEDQSCEDDEKIDRLLDLISEANDRLITLEAELNFLRAIGPPKGDS